MYHKKALDHFTKIAEGFSALGYTALYKKRFPGMARTYLLTEKEVFENTLSAILKKITKKEGIAISPELFLAAANGKIPSLQENIHPLSKREKEILNAIYFSYHLQVERIPENLQTIYDTAFFCWATRNDASLESHIFTRNTRMTFPEVFLCLYEHYGPIQKIDYFLNLAFLNTYMHEYTSFSQLCRISLQHAVQNKEKETVQLLVDHLAENICEADKQEALYHAIKKGALEIATFLLQHSFTQGFDCFCKERVLYMLVNEKNVQAMGVLLPYIEQPLLTQIEKASLKKEKIFLKIMKQILLYLSEVSYTVENKEWILKEVLLNTQLSQKECIDIISLVAQSTEEGLSNINIADLLNLTDKKDCSKIIPFLFELKWPAKAFLLTHENKEVPHTSTGGPFHPALINNTSLSLSPQRNPNIAQKQYGKILQATHKKARKKANPLSRVLRTAP